MRTTMTIVGMALALQGSGCVTGTRSDSVFGRPVRVVPAAGAEAGPVEGELIAVETGRIWVLGEERVFEVPLAAIREVRVQRHGLNTKRGWLWTGLGALMTAGALAYACNAVPGNDRCEVVFGVVAASWAVGGGLPSMLLDRSATIRMKQPDPDALRPYARFPQGPPGAVDLRRLPPPREPE